MRKLSVSLFCAACLLQACSLKEDVISYSRPADYYTSVQQCEAGLNGCYNDLRSVYNNTNYFLVCETQTDLMVLNRSDRPDACLNIKPSSPRMGATIWRYSYEGVMRTNAVFAAIERSPLSASEKLPLLAEATILRALYYYTLTANFGDVPYYEEEVTGSNNDRISRLGRMSASFIRSTLIDQLRYYLIDNKSLPLAPTHSADNPKRYRAGAALGYMLAGKMCLWEKRWNEAIEFFGYLEDIYGNGAGRPEGSLDRYPLADIPFGVHNCDESIWETTNFGVDYGLKVAGSLACYCTPARTSPTKEADGDTDEDQDIEDALASADYYKGIGIPAMGTQQRTYDAIRPTQRFYMKLMPQDSPDRRRAQYDAAGNPIPDAGGYLAWGWVGYGADDDRSVKAPSYRKFSYTTLGGPGDQITNVPWLGNKFWCFGMQYTSDTNAYKFFRFATALLGLAEAHCQNGDPDMAVRYLNVIKSRAGISTVSTSDFATGEALMEEIQDECARELFGEFQRKHDLVRWGIWYDMVMKYNVGPTGSKDGTGGMNNHRMAANIQPCHRYYPIPDEQITYSGGALDNKEYNQYGL